MRLCLCFFFFFFCKEAQHQFVLASLTPSSPRLLSSGLYYVDSEGNRVCGDLFAVGSGSMYAYGVMDSGLRQDLSVEEACELGRRAIYQATYRDAYSGGQVNLYHVHSEGWTRISQDDVLVLHQQYKAQQ